MRSILLVLLSLPVLSASAQTPAAGAPAARRVSMERLREIWRMQADVAMLRPTRRDGPLRELNITDDEIREIQIIAARYAMSTMINISPVVTGCPCEDGPLCTDQVYVVSQKPEESAGLLLSRVRNKWVVGPVQAWFMRYENLLGRQRELDFDEFLGRQRLLLLEFPKCVGKDDETTP